MARRTIVNYIVDESGSMSNITNQTIEGFNNYMDSLGLQVDEGEVLVTFTKFSTSVSIPFSAKPLHEVPRITASDYRPNGSTALYDAIGNTVAQVERQQQAGDKVLVVVVTDGAENASRSFSKDQIAALIKRKDEVDDWTFVYMGSDHNAWGQAQHLGFKQGNTVTYQKAAHGQAMNDLASHTAGYAGSSSAKTDSFFGGSTPGAARPI